MKTSFEPTDKQQLYVRQPTGTFYARLYVHAGTKWISLKTRVKGVAKVELAKLLQQHYAVREAEASTRKGTATMGELSAVYLHGVDLDTDPKPKTKEYRPCSCNLLKSHARAALIGGDVIPSEAEGSEMV